MQVISFKNWLDLNEGFEDEPYSFHAVFMAGGPASGKTTVAQSMFAGLGFKFSSSDFFYERLSHKKGFNANAEGQNMAAHPDHPIATQARGQATKLAIRQSSPWRQIRYPVVIDVTARDKESIVNIDNGLKEIGYDTFMVFVNTDLPKAIERNSRRGQEGGASTYVPRAAGTQETDKFWHEVQANKEFFQQRFGGTYVEVDNSQDTQVPGPGQQNVEYRQKQMEWTRTAMKLLGPPKKVRNPIGAAMLAKGTDYNAWSQSQPQPSVNAGKPQQPQLGVA